MSSSHTNALTTHSTAQALTTKQQRATHGQRRLQGSHPHKNKPQACAKQFIAISAEQLPLCCPLPNQRVWDAHPRVYFDMTPEHPEAICPYCGTHYQLQLVAPAEDSAGEV